MSGRVIDNSVRNAAILFVIENINQKDLCHLRMLAWAILVIMMDDLNSDLLLLNALKDVIFACVGNAVSWQLETDNCYGKRMEPS